jgi:HD-GYP domain-containing protein (c-di-GMP phosphodiesterase class II)
MGEIKAYDRPCAELPGRLAPRDCARLNLILSALGARDAPTRDHSARTARLCVALGRGMGLDPAALMTLGLGALLHDVGKMRVPDAILHKPGPLTDEEWVAMRRHPEDGRLIIEGVGFLEGAAALVVQHHERWDGTGYPAGLRGESIAPGARILAVADAFDVMTHEREYRAPMSKAAALAELERCAGSQFDARVVSAFRRAHIARRPLANAPRPV